MRLKDPPKKITNESKVLMNHIFNFKNMILLFSQCVSSITASK